MKKRTFGAEYKNIIGVGGVGGVAGRAGAESDSHELQYSAKSIKELEKRVYEKSSNGVRRKA